MRKAKEYEKRIRKLLSGAGRLRPPAAPSGNCDQVRVLVESILQADASRKQAEQAYNALLKEFVDFNDLRVAPVKEIADCFGRGFPGAREKAETIIRVLNGTFDRNGNIGMEYMTSLAKRDLRRHLLELGLGPYASASVALLAFQTHAVPVDRSLAECLEMDRCIHPGSELTDVQGFLERIVPQEDALAVHEFFRRYVEKNAKALAKKHRAEALAQAKAAPAGAKARSADEAEQAEESEEARGGASAAAEAGEKAAAARKEMPAPKEAKAPAPRPAGKRPAQRSKR